MRTFMKIIDHIVHELELRLKAINQEREAVGVPPCKKAEIAVLGQMSLLMDKSASKALPLAATMDIDALIKGDETARQELLIIIKTKGLVLDDLSSEIWLPKDAAFIEYYDSHLLRVTYLDPISALTSKAVKAREKNRVLIKTALAHYGAELQNKIESNGGDVAYFTQKQDIKL